MSTSQSAHDYDSISRIVAALKCLDREASYAPKTAWLESFLYRIVIGFQSSDTAQMEVSQLDGLRAITARAGGNNRGWVISEANNSFVTARKCGWEATFPSADLVGTVKVGDTIAVPSSTGYYDEVRDAFLVNNGLFGHPLRGRECRIYANIDYDSVLPAVSVISNALVERSIPFKMKCPTKLESFKRHDSVVFYVRQEHLSVSARVVTFLSGLSSLLREGTPMFAYRISRGLAFAESPRDGSSFCQSVVKKLAGIIETVGYNSNEEDIVSEMKIRSMNLGNIYRSSDSFFEYNLISYHE